jgi:hypothetical protein
MNDEQKPVAPADTSAAPADIEIVAEPVVAEETPVVETPEVAPEVAPEAPQA